MITIKSVFHSYSGHETIAFPDWEVARGEQWLLLGESGSGKTTLLHMLTGILKPSSGRVLVNGVDLSELRGAEMDHFRGRYIGVVFQQSHLIKSLTVKENLLLAQSFAGLKKDESRIDQVLSQLDIGQKKNSYPAELSQGQLQRAAIARAVLNKPALLIADEPTSSLDNKNARAVVSLLSDLSRDVQATLVVSTHDARVKEAFLKEYML